LLFLLFGFIGRSLGFMSEFRERTVGAGMRPVTGMVKECLCQVVVPVWRLGVKFVLIVIGR
jgi:hypothetical protein